MKKFVHKNFIQNRKFAIEDERFLLENLVMKEDWETEKKIKEEALDNQARLEIEVNEKSRELSDVNRRLKLSLAQHKAQLTRISQLELEKDELRSQVNEIQMMLDEMKSKEVSKTDEVDGTAVWEPLKSQSSTSSTINDELFQMQAEELDYTRQQLDILKEKIRMSNCKLNALTDKVKEFLKETCKLESELNAGNTPMQKLESCVLILMNQMKGLVLENKNADAKEMVEKEDLAELKLKDKLNETRKQKAIMKTELHKVLKRLKDITKELETEKERVKHLETEIQTRDSLRDTPVSEISSRAKTPVSVHFPVLDARSQRQKAMYLWKSMPSGISTLKELIEDEVDSLGADLVIRNSKPKQDLTPILSRSSISRASLSSVQMQCSRCHTVYGFQDAKVKQTCRYHPGFYVESKNPGQASRWSCCGQTNRASLGCRYGNHIAKAL